MRPLTTLFALPLLLSPLVAAQTLGIEVTKAVSCNRKTENGDTISAHYRGTLQSDGTEFDSSYNRGTPFKFKLGAGQVIKGWDQGLLGMCIGEGRKLTIPPNLGYGYEASGPIPAGSTLVFETELVGIDGVEKEEEVPVAPARPTIAKPAEGASESESPPETPTPTPTSAPAKTTIIVAPSAKLIPDPAKATSGASPMAAGDDNNGECNLLGRYALIVQGALGLLAVSSLAFKRWRETPRRPLKIWFFDASKQVFGSVLLHLANILMSMLSSGSFDVAAKTKATPQYAGADEDGKSPNPCSFYLLNLAIDTTIGIPILVLLLKLLHRGFSLTPLANPPESIRSGNYGHPPHALWWLKQSFIYFLGLFGMKFCVFLLFQLLPWIAWVGDWALRWTEGNAAVQITFVMFIFPLCMNAMQYWIIDGFIKEQGGQGEGYVGVEGSEDGSEEDEEWLERRRRGRSGEELDSDVEAGEEDTLKEANPTPVPIRRGTGKDKEYDPEVDGRQGGSSRDR